MTERLVVDGFGKSIGIDQGQVVVKERKGKTMSAVYRCLPSELRQVVITGKGSISTEAMRVLAQHGVDIVLLDGRGRVIAHILPPEMRTVSTRREQYKAYENEKGAQLAKEFVLAKLKNQSAVLLTLAKTRKDTSPEIASYLKSAREEVKMAQQMVEQIVPISLDEQRDKLMGIEGMAGSVYWDVISRVVPEEFGFFGRSGRYAQDPVNAMLNYGYGLLEGECWRAVYYAGLDPYGGFLHVDRPGRASMVFDLMEEFRAQIVDKSVLKLINLSMVDVDDFTIEDGVCRIGDKTRRILIKEVLSKFEDVVRWGDRKMRWTDVILSQARGVASFLRGETKKYVGFSLRW
jgi:CRISPR-associated protein Cas1